MHTVYIDSGSGERERLERLYAELLVFARPSTIALCDFAREMIEEAFAPHAPLEAQYHMPVEEWVGRFAPVKPAFIHHPRTKGLIRDILVEMGCDADETYMDVPRLRGVTSDGYLTSGVGYAHHPHRDTWYSAPMAQLNWWLPIYPFETTSSMAFHPRYWGEGVENGSGNFNYYEWSTVGRKDASKHIASDTRKQPKAEQHVELEPQVRVVCRRRRHRAVLRRPHALDRAEHVGPRPVQHRLPHGEPGRPAGRPSALQRRLVAHRHVAARLVRASDQALCPTTSWRYDTGAAPTPRMPCWCSDPMRRAVARSWRVRHPDPEGQLMARADLPSWGRRSKHNPQHMGARIPWWRGQAWRSAWSRSLWPCSCRRSRRRPSRRRRSPPTTSTARPRRPWSVTDPAGDGTVAMTGAGSGDARLELSVPGGAAHEPWNANGALQAMRPAANTDFTAEAKFQSVPTQRYQLQGILVQQDADDWLRFEIHHNGTGLRLRRRHDQRGQHQEARQAGGHRQRLYLRVARRHHVDALDVRQRHDMDDGRQLHPGLHRVGGRGLRWQRRQPAPAYTALVDYLFETSAPISPEDGSGTPADYTLTTNTSSTGVDHPLTRQAQLHAGRGRHADRRAQRRIHLHGLVGRGDRRRQPDRRHDERRHDRHRLVLGGGGRPGDLRGAGHPRKAPRS